jgi:pyridoxine kinase
LLLTGTGILQADVITPNQFETEQLTGVTIKTTADAQHACRVLHDMGVPLVLITSITLPDAKKTDTQSNDPVENPPANSIGMFASRRRCTAENEADYTDEQYILYTPLLSGQFTGTGDICAALFLAWTANMPNDTYLGDALEKLAGETTFALCFYIFVSGNLSATSDLLPS